MYVKTTTVAIKNNKLNARIHPSVVKVLTASITAAMPPKTAVLIHKEAVAVPNAPTKNRTIATKQKPSPPIKGINLLVSVVIALFLYS